MDIRLVISRVAVFVLVYGFVLGLPFWVGSTTKLWVWAMGLMAVLASFGPFVYSFLQRRIEAHIFQEERRIHKTIVQAATRMASIREIPKLDKLIIDILTKSININKAALYLFRKDDNQYVLQEFRDDFEGYEKIPADRTVVAQMRSRFAPIIYEEIRMQTEQEGRAKGSAELLDFMKELDAQVVMPIHMDQELLGFIVLGERAVEEGFTDGIINALRIFAEEIAQAVENCHYWEDTKRRMEEEGAQKRMVSLDAMASSFAHEVDNPIGVVLGQIGFMDEMLDDARVAMPEEVKQDLRGSFNFIADSVKRVSSMIKSILEYSRLGKGEFHPVSIYELLDSFDNLIGPQMKKENVQFNKDVEYGLPFIFGEKVQLEEILMNFATNAMHAVRDRKEKKVNLKVFKKDRETIRLEYSDNGYGIPKKIINDIFLPSVTTKGSSEGTGLGLYRTRKIIDAHKGQIWVESEGKDRGTTFIVELPAFKGEMPSGEKDSEETHKIF